MALFGNKKTQETKKKDEPKASRLKNEKKSAAEAKPSMKDLYGTAEKKVTATIPKAGEEKSVAAVKPMVSDAYRVLLRPIVSEKGSHLGAENKYLFEVDYHANKIEIAKAINSAYGIKPVKINVIKMAGKVVRRGRVTGRRKNWKKAIVTLPAGKTIQIYEGI